MGSSPSSGMKKPRKCRASALQAPSRASRSDLGLCGGRTSPQGPGVGPVGVQFHHRVEQLTRGRGRFIETVEVAQVLLGRRDVPRVVVVVGDLGDVLDQQPAPRRARRDDLIALLIDYPEPCCDAPRTRGTACGLGRRPEAGSAATEPLAARVVAKPQPRLHVRARLVRPHRLTELRACLVAALPVVLRTAERFARRLAAGWAKRWGRRHDDLIPGLVAQPDDVLARAAAWRCRSRRPEAVSCPTDNTAVPRGDPLLRGLKGSLLAPALSRARWSPSLASQPLARRP